MRRIEDSVLPGEPAGRPWPGGCDTASALAAGLALTALGAASGKAVIGRATPKAAKSPIRRKSAAGG